MPLSNCATEPGSHLSFFPTQTNMADVSKWKPDDRVVSEYLDVVATVAKAKDMLLTPESLADDLVRPKIAEMSKIDLTLELLINVTRVKMALT